LVNVNVFTPDKFSPTEPVPYSCMYVYVAINFL
jgi:hypothetical protein